MVWGFGEFRVSEKGSLALFAQQYIGWLTPAPVKYFYAHEATFPDSAVRSTALIVEIISACVDKMLMFIEL